MLKKSVLLCSVIYLFVITFKVFAIDAKASSSSDKFPEVKSSGVIFMRYDYDLTDISKGKGFNKLDIERTYFTIDSAIASNTKVKVVFDIYQNTKSVIIKDAGGNEVKVPSYYDGWSVRLKNAYADITPIPIMTIRAGMLGSPWTCVVEKSWNYRFIKKVLVDSEKLLDTADLGAGLVINLPGDHGEAMFAVLNGPGYTKPESDKFKDINPRITFVPLPKNEMLKGLSISGHYYLGKRSDGKNDYDRNRMGALLSFTNSFVNIGSEFGISNDQKLDKNGNIEDVNGMGFSTFGELKFAKITTTLIKNMGLIVRIDSWDPNTEAENDAHNVLLAGIIYTMTKNFRTCLSYQQFSYEDSKIETARQISCQAEVKF